ncbi:MAG: hypothetical protein ABH854_01510 [Candidatus Diapherotrites archaeon]
MFKGKKYLPFLKEYRKLISADFGIKTKIPKKIQYVDNPELVATVKYPKKRWLKGKIVVGSAERPLSVMVVAHEAGHIAFFDLVRALGGREAQSKAMNKRAHELFAEIEGGKYILAHEGGLEALREYASGLANLEEEARKQLEMLEKQSAGQENNTRVIFQKIMAQGPIFMLEYGQKIYAKFSTREQLSAVQLLLANKMSEITRHYEIGGPTEIDVIVSANRKPLNDSVETEVQKILALNPAELIKGANKVRVAIAKSPHTAGILGKFRLVRKKDSRK